MKEPKLKDFVYYENVSGVKVMHHDSYRYEEEVKKYNKYLKDLLNEVFGLAYCNINSELENRVHIALA